MKNRTLAVTLWTTVVTTAIGLVTANSASAIATLGKVKFSKKVFTKCIGKEPSTSKVALCNALAIAADPPPEGITDIGTSISYNPSKWIFQSQRSGFLCSFSVSGDCPSSDSLIGTIPIGDTPDINFTPGSSLSGSTFSLTNDNVNGLVTLTYQLAQPLDSSGEQNFFSFYFEAATPVLVSSITYYDQPGNYDFKQLNSSCKTINGTCCSNNPVEGSDINEVPEPLTILGSVAALGFGAYAECKRKSSNSSEKDDTKDS